MKVTPLPSGFRLLWLVFGFAEKPDVPAALRLHPEAIECDPDEASFFLGRETPVPSLRWTEIEEMPNGENLAGVVGEDNIFAAGDIARWPDPHTGESIRVEVGHAAKWDEERVEGDLAHRDGLVRFRRARAAISPWLASNATTSHSEPS